MRCLKIIFLIFLVVSCKSPKTETSEYLLDNTSKIIIMSYPERTYWDVRNDNAIIENNKILFDTTMVKDKIQLKNDDIKTFIKILNKEFVSSDGVDQISTCYLPRHLAIFYDKNNKVIAYLESCFNCGTTLTSKNLEVFSGFDLDNLKEFYKKINVKYFVDSEEDEKKERKYLDSIKLIKKEKLK